MFLTKIADWLNLSNLSLILRIKRVHETSASQNPLRFFWNVCQQIGNRVWFPAPTRPFCKGFSIHHREPYQPSQKSGNGGISWGKNQRRKIRIFNLLGAHWNLPDRLAELQRHDMEKDEGKKVYMRFYQSLRSTFGALIYTLIIRFTYIVLAPCLYPRIPSCPWTSEAHGFHRSFERQNDLTFAFPKNQLDTAPPCLNH